MVILLQMAIHAARTGEIEPFIMASIDQEKAFDRVNHGRLDAVLEAAGFPPQCRRLLAGLHGNSKIAFTANGWTTSTSKHSGLRPRLPLPSKDPVRCICG